MQARASFAFGNKNENNILVSGLVSGEQTASKDKTHQNSSGARIAVIKKRGLSNRNLKNITVSSYQQDNFPHQRN